MTTKQTIKAWKNVETSTDNSPVSAVNVDANLLAKVQGGANNIVYTGCIPDPFPFPKGKGGPWVTSCPIDDVILF